MKYKVGDILKVKEGCEGECASFKDNNGKYIKITAETTYDFYSYYILNEKKEKVSWCCRCLTDEHLEPLELIIHCPTKELSNQVLKKLEGEGVVWTEGQKPTELNHWDEYKENTCYYLKDNKLKFSDKSFWQIECPNVPIISAEEYLGEETTKDGYSGLTIGGFQCGDVINYNGTTTCDYSTTIPESNVHAVLNTSEQLNNKPKLMNKVISAIKDLGVSSDEKLLRKWGMLDEGLNWTREGILATYELESQERGYKSTEGLNQKVTQGEGSTTSVFELDDLIKKHLPALLEQCKKLEAEEKKKK